VRDVQFLTNLSLTGLDLPNLGRSRLLRQLGGADSGYPKLLGWCLSKFLGRQQIQGFVTPSTPFAEIAVDTSLRR
jgi:hypothetical protein